MAAEQGRVLVADDEDSVRSLLQRALSQAGYNVVTAADGRDALDKASQLNISIALLDIKMPEVSGMEVLQRLIASQPSICVIMVTALGDAQTAVEALKLGAYDYITKPFNVDEVLQKVQKAIEKRDLRLDDERYRQHLEETIKEQADRLQHQFVELLETLAREHRLLYRLAGQQRGGGSKSFLSLLPPELQEPMSSVEEFSDALLRILKRSR